MAIRLIAPLPSIPNPPPLPKRLCLPVTNRISSSILALQTTIEESDLSPFLRSLQPKLNLPSLLASQLKRLWKQTLGNPFTPKTPFPFERLPTELQIKILSDPDCPDTIDQTSKRILKFSELAAKDTFRKISTFPAFSSLQTLMRKFQSTTSEEESYLKRLKRLDWTLVKIFNPTPFPEPNTSRISLRRYQIWEKMLHDEPLRRMGFHLMIFLDSLPIASNPIPSFLMDLMDLNLHSKGAKILPLQIKTLLNNPSVSEFLAENDVMIPSQFDFEKDIPERYIIVPKEITKINLQHLLIDVCLLTEDSFKNLNRITGLHLFYRGKIPNNLYLPPTLTKLGLDGAEINHSTLFDKTPQITTLFLQNVQWNAETPKKPLPSLEEFLQLECTMPNDFINSLVRNPRNLKRLEIATINNPFKVFPPKILEMINLELLSLQGHEIEKIPNEIARLSQLKLLDLEYSRIRELPQNINQSIESINLSHNRIETIPPGFLKNCNQLKSVDLSHNQLTELPKTFLHDSSHIKIRLNIQFNQMRKSFPEDELVFNSLIVSFHPQHNQIVDAAIPLFKFLMDLPNG